MTQTAIELPPSGTGFPLIPFISIHDERLPDDADDSPQVTPPPSRARAGRGPGNLFRAIFVRPR